MTMIQLSFQTSFILIPPPTHDNPVNKQKNKTKESDLKLIFPSTHPDMCFHRRMPLITTLTEIQNTDFSINVLQVYTEVIPFLVEFKHQQLTFKSSTLLLSLAVQTYFGISKTLIHVKGNFEQWYDFRSLPRLEIKAQVKLTQQIL